MKASKKSLHARIYRYVYSEKLPTNLCPYFWKVLLGIFLLIPSFITRIPLYLIFLITKFFNKGIKDYQELVDAVNSNNCKWSESIIGLFAVLLINLLISIIIAEFYWFKWLFNCYSYDSAAATVGGLINICIVGGVVIYYLNTSKTGYSDDPNIIKEFIKAKYNKYCPKIDWDK